MKNKISFSFRAFSTFCLKILLANSFSRIKIVQYKLLELQKYYYSNLKLEIAHIELNH